VHEGVGAENERSVDWASMRPLLCSNPSLSAFGQLAKHAQSLSASTAAQQSRLDGLHVTPSGPQARTSLAAQQSDAVSAQD
jgi:hypothetical protein